MDELEVGGYLVDTEAEHGSHKPQQEPGTNLLALLGAGQF